MLLLLVGYGVVAGSLSLAVITNIFKIILVNFFPIYIMYEVIEYQSLLEIQKERVDWNIRPASMKKLEQSHTFGCSVQFHDFIFLDLHGADSDEVNCDLVLCHSLVSKPSDHFTDFAKFSSK